MTDTLADVLHYHRVTKHAPGRYARSAGIMDWENQPNPFRLYSGVPVLPLPFDTPDPTDGHLSLYQRNRNRPRPFDLVAIGKLLELSLGISAWKGAGKSRWALRMNPSSGNLHPTEAHLLIPGGPTGGEGCGGHYSPLTHVLEQRASLPSELWQQLREHCGGDGLLVVLTSIHWRESWKYGERALRYCLLDAGHALAGLSFAAALLGWRLTCLPGLAPARISRMLGFDRIDWPAGETERPDLACWIGCGHRGTPAADLPEALVDRLAALPWAGHPNRLSPAVVDWEIIARTADLAAGPLSAPGLPGTRYHPLMEEAVSSLSGAQILRRRRSATDFDHRHPAIPLAQFRLLLDKTLPRHDLAPFDARLPPPAIDLALFVHRVEGIAAGLYLLLRRGDEIAAMAAEMAPDFAWRKADAQLPLFCLQCGDLRQIASHLSCDQPIAGESAFSLGMIADFETLRREGTPAYRRLFWEAGMIGQVLYVEAEAHGLRATGIGCFFDDEVHRVLGLRSERFQSLYHLTVGRPVEDRRLTTLPPYAEAERLRQRIHGRNPNEESSH